MVPDCSTLLKLVVPAPDSDSDSDGEAETGGSDVSVAAIHALRRFFLNWCKSCKQAAERPAKSDVKRKSKRQRRAEAAERAAIEATGATVKAADGDTSSATTGASASATEQLRKWVRGKYRRFLSSLTNLLYRGSDVQQVRPRSVSVRSLARLTLRHG